MRYLFKIVDKIVHLIGDDNFWATLPPICYISSSSLFMMIGISLMHKTADKLKLKHQTYINYEQSLEENIESIISENEIKKTEAENIKEKDTQINKIKYEYHFDENKIDNDNINVDCFVQKKRKYLSKSRNINNIKKKHIS